MDVRRALSALARVVADRAERDPEFGTQIRKALGARAEIDSAAELKKKYAVREKGILPQRPANRRAPAALDPVRLARQGELVLRAELGRLNLEQLRDIVAEYGMDTGKLVLKWRTPERVISRIVEVAIGRAQKGSAFREPAETGASTSTPKTTHPPSARR